MTVRESEVYIVNSGEGQRPSALCATISVISFAGNQLNIAACSRFLENSEKQRKPWNNTTIYYRMHIKKGLNLVLKEVGVFLYFLCKITIVSNLCCFIVQRKGCKNTENNLFRPWLVPLPVYHHQTIHFYPKKDKMRDLLPSICNVAYNICAYM